MTQNIYDTEDFFDNYSQLPRSIEGLAGAPEWPALKAQLPAMSGLQVLDLGCGYGWFCRWADEQGASRILGLDVSRKMLARAASMTHSPVIEYRQADLEQLALTPNSYDLAYSSLALHYIENLQGLLQTLYQALKPGGQLVFSIEHPIFMAPRDPVWLSDSLGRKSWPLNSYQLEGPRVTDWLAPNVIKHHRTLGTLLNLLIASGFSLRHVQEWGPDCHQLASQPALAEEQERPMILLVAAQR